MKESVKKYIPLLLYTAACLLLFAAINAAIDRQTEFTLFFDGWWTLFITVPAVGDMINRRVKTGNLVAFISGAVLFAALQDFSSPSAVWKLALPVIVLIIGFGVVYKGIRSKKKEDEDDVSVIAVFSKTKAEAEENETVKSVFCLAIFGKATLDLSRAELTQETQIRLICVFAKISLLLPEEVTGNAKGLLIFSGCRNRKQGEDIRIDYNTVFGETEIQ